MMMAAKQCMVDTNVLVYATVSGNPWHNAARNWITTLQQDNTVLWITTQIVREYLVILTRGQVFSQTFTIDEALNEIEALFPSFEIAGESEASLVRLRAIVRQYQIQGKQIHDANLVAVMLTHGILHLATYNETDFKRFQEISLEVPPPFAQPQAQA